MGCKFQDDEKYCYDCPHRYCQCEDEKYKKLKNRAKDHIGEGLYWISIDFESNDTTTKRAFDRFRKWLEAEGFVGRDPSYKKWIGYCGDGPNKPVGLCYHTGTFYFHKIKE